MLVINCRIGLTNGSWWRSGAPTHPLAMDPLAMVVDVGAVVRELALATAQRLAAAKRLPETVNRVKRTMGHVVGATDDVQHDKQTETVLTTEWMPGWQRW